MDERERIYTERKLRFEKEAVVLGAKVRNLSIIRVVLFIFSISLLVYLLNIKAAWPAAGGLLVFVFFFGLLVNLHQKVKKQYSFLRSLALVNHDELNRLQLNLKSFNPGTVYLSEAHPYASDLDIFGSYSIFQVLNRATTEAGRNHLAQWLLKPSGGEEVHTRQKAVHDLARQLEWRQLFEAKGRMQMEELKSLQNISEQLLLPPKAISSGSKGIAALCLLISAAIYALLAGGLLSWHWMFACLTVNGLFLASLMKSMQEEYIKMGNLTKRLAVFVGLFEAIESASFEDEQLKRIQASLLPGGKSASREFAALAGIVSHFDNRTNLLYQLLNGFLLLDFWLLFMAQRWFNKNNAHIADWMEALGETEALSSLAGFAWSNPAYTFPSMSAEELHLECVGVGHPLIVSGKRVQNDFSLKGKSLLLITGSNMSGKSTFLRTIGVNMVLGLAGAPVCADSFSLSYMQVFTSMRTHDDLQESVSSFYAELRRIRQLLDLLATKTPVLYMLDEVLKGTNSEDRNKGTEALVHQLLKENAAGFISTHDLSLSKLSQTTSPVKNYSFNSQVVGDELLFDYKLTEGPCRSFNASQLMKNIGIEIIP